LSQVPAIGLISASVSGARRASPLVAFERLLGDGMRQPPRTAAEIGDDDDRETGAGTRNRAEARPQAAMPDGLQAADLPTPTLRR
jgi:hypothetical protein